MINENNYQYQQEINNFTSQEILNYYKNHESNNYKHIPLFISNSNVLSQEKVKNCCYTYHGLELPLIIINSEYYEKFIDHLKSSFYYIKFQNISILNNLILSTKNIKNYQNFHISIEQNLFLFAEVIDNCKNYYNQKEEELIKKEISLQKIKINISEFLCLWVNTIFDLLA